MHNRLPCTPCDRGNQLPPAGGLFLGLIDEVDAASGARVDWGRDSDGNDGDAGAVS